MDIQKYLEDNRQLLQQNKIKEFLEFVYNDPSITEKEKADIFTFVNDILQYFNQPNSYNFDYVPGWANFSGTVYVGEGTKSIKAFQFYKANFLQSVHLPASLKTIRYHAFHACTSLESIVIPDSVTKIELSAFDSCTSLQSITIPDSVVEIGQRAFADCTSLQSANLPKDLTHLGEDVFKGCESLKEVIIPKSLDPAIYEGKIPKAKIKVI